MVIHRGTPLDSALVLFDISMWWLYSPLRVPRLLTSRLALKEVCESVGPGAFRDHSTDPSIGAHRAHEKIDLAIRFS